MADIVTFGVQFPEFSNLLNSIPGQAQIQAFLNASALEVDVNMFGPKADQAIYYLTAHDLCMSPFGQNAKMAIVKGKSGYEATTYGQKFARIQLQVSSGFRVC